MTKEQKLVSKKARLGILENNGKNGPTSGVIKRLKREIRNLEK